MLGLYRALAWPAAPPALLYFALRQRPELRLWERLGGEPFRDDRPVWIQASSVGEVRLALRLCREFHARGIPTQLTSTTATGLAMAAREIGGAFPVAAFPLDLPPVARRALARVRPRALVLIETELWPNFLLECRRAGVPAAIVNARLSDRTLGRFHLLKALVGPLASELHVGAQDSENLRRFRALGVAPSRSTVTGNMKYDVQPPSNFDQSLESIGALFPDPKPFTWIAGSVREGEEGLVLESHSLLRESVPEARLILAPRHLNRVSRCQEATGRAGFRGALRSAAPPTDWDVLILDAMGELQAAYGNGDAAFVGGSLVPLGGQNLLEPAQLGKPVLFGPHTENFRLESQRLEEEGGGVRVADPESLARELSGLYSKPSFRLLMGERARSVVEAHRGATRRCADLVVEISS
jgi:3-deoxy-D-manno-octulosonic-acid transferase